MCNGVCNAMCGAICVILLYNNLGKRHLIYVSFTDNYFDCAKLLLKSLDHFLTRKDVDVLLITTESGAELVRNWLQANPGTRRNRSVRYLVFVSNSQSWYSHRFELPPEIFSKYNKCLYLDTDILITHRRINQLFDEHLEPDTLYVLQEGDEPHEIYHKLPGVVYPEGTKPFNSGQWMFVYSPQFKEYFNKALDLIDKFPLNTYAIDQRVANYVFLNAKQIGLLDTYAKTFPEESVDYGSMQFCIVHFCGNISNSSDKLTRMNRYIQKHKLTIK